MTEKLRVLIVDDEPLALDYMERLLGAVDDIVIIARCRSGREALAELQRQAVDLMFLDIQTSSKRFSFKILLRNGFAEEPLAIHHHLPARPSPGPRVCCLRIL